MTVWSTFGRRLVALPGAGSFLTALGVSAFIQTLLDDADAATARTTLVAVGLTGNETVAGVKTFSSNPILSGGGIEFPGTQVSSAGVNVLDDYEEGTWTPTVIGSTTPGTATYTTQIGTYTKIGKVVCYFGRTGYSGHTGTGNQQMSGLPFTVNGSLPAMVRVSNVTYAGNFLQAFAQNGATLVNFEQVSAAGVASSLAIDAAADINVAGIYFV